MDAKITARKTMSTGITVSIAGVVALALATKLNVWLSSAGVQIPVETLVVIITAAGAAGFRGASNWIKHRGKK